MPDVHARGGAWTGSTIASIHLFSSIVPPPIAHCGSPLTGSRLPRASASQAIGHDRQAFHPCKPKLDYLLPLDTPKGRRAWSIAPTSRDRVARRAGPAMPDVGRPALAGTRDHTARQTRPPPRPDGQRQPFLDGLDMGFQGGRCSDEMAAPKMSKKMNRMT
jgi:hypothetical protein